ncbi:hypothetical protein CKO28_03295 [Rhodovibrio sodomensis]|uniref:J domain-containing protein n=1 Tax=Rhodovibrio sodomensis TaxID=1088 RepID=A0ABS1DCE9_9PROT|nr:hypothetical protein [Rhodovibrio sodomensis]MBK1667070.1 hypothetical protein [Rhodovibrio sodomensis]
MSPQTIDLYRIDPSASPADRPLLNSARALLLSHHPDTYRAFLLMSASYTPEQRLRLLRAFDELMQGPRPAARLIEILREHPTELDALESLLCRRHADYLVDQHSYA